MTDLAKILSRMSTANTPSGVPKVTTTSGKSLRSPYGRTLTSLPRPAEKAQKTSADYNKETLQRRITSILDSDSPTLYKVKAARLSAETPTSETESDGGILGGIFNNPVVKGLSKGLQYIGAAVDTPRRLVASTLNKAITWGDSNWWDDFTGGLGGGDIIERQGWWDNILPDFISETQYVGDFTKGLIGFGVDVATDPLTYLGPGPAAKGLTAANKAVRLLSEAGLYSKQLGKVDDATKFANTAQKAAKGLSHLNKEERLVVQQLAKSEADRLGTQVAKLAPEANQIAGGLYLNVPGTGTVSNFARRLIRMEPTPQKSILLLRPSETLSRVPRLLRTSEEFVRKSGVGRAFAKTFVQESKRNAINALRRGTNADDILEYGYALNRALPQGTAKEAMFFRRVAQKLVPLIDQMDRAGIDLDDATRAGAGDQEAYNRIVAGFGGDARAVQLADETREASRDMARLYNDVLGVAEGDEFAIPIYDLHVALQRSDDLIDLLKETGQLPKEFRGKFSATKLNRRTRPGETFLGEKLRHPTEDLKMPDGTVLTAHPEGLSVPEQMNNIAKSVFGDDYAQLFTLNFRDNMERQMRALGRQIRRVAIEKELRDLGVSKSMYSEILTPEILAGQSKARQLIDKIPGLRQSAAENYLELENSKQLLGDAEKIIAGSKEQMAVYRAEARLARAQRNMADDPTIKGMLTKLRDVRDKEELLDVYRAIERQLAEANFLEDTLQTPEEVLKPFRDAVEQAVKDIDQNVADAIPKLKKSIDDIDKKIAQTIETHQKRELAVGLYSSLAQRSSRWANVVAGLLNETISPFKVGSQEYSEITSIVRSDLEFSIGQAKQLDTIISQVTSALASTKGAGIVGSTAESVLLLVRHPMSGLNPQQVANVERLVAEGGAANVSKIRKSVNLASKNIKDGYAKEAERYNNILRGRVDLTRNESLRFASEELRRIGKEMNDVGETRLVSEIGMVDSKLPIVDGNGNMVSSANVAARRAPDVDYVQSRITEFSNLDFGDDISNALRGNVAAQVGDLYAAVDDLGPQFLLENPEAAVIFDDFEELIDRMGKLDPLADNTDQLAAEVEALNDISARLNQPFNKDIYNVTSSPFTGTDLPNIRNPHNLPSGDSLLGLHFAPDPRFPDQMAELGIAGRAGQRVKKIASRFRVSPKNIKVYGPRGADYRYGSKIGFKKLPQNNQWFGGRAALNGDMLRSAIEQGALTRADIELLTSRLGKVGKTSKQQTRFWNKVFDLFEATQDAGAALRQAVAEEMSKSKKLRSYIDELTSVADDSVEAAQGAAIASRYEDEAVDFIAGQMLRSGGYRNVLNDVPDIALNLPEVLMQKIVTNFRESMIRQGYDSVAYVVDPRVGWATIVLDPKILKPVDGGKNVAELFAKRERFYSKFIRQHEKVLERYAEAKRQLGVELSGMTTDFEKAAGRVDDLEQELADVTQRLDEILDGSPRAQALLAEEQMLRTRALALQKGINKRAELLQAEVDAAGVDLATKIDNVEKVRAELGVAQLESGVASASADYLAKFGEMIDLESMASQLRRRHFEKAFEEGYSQLGLYSQAPDQIVEAVEVFTKMRDPQQISAFLRYWDKATNFFKSYATLTPGFHVRNFLGGVFNNWLAGVDSASYRAFRRADKVFENAYREARSAPVDIRGVMRLRSEDEAYQIGLDAVKKRLGQNYADAYAEAYKSNSFFTAGQIGSTGIEAGIRNAGDGLVNTIRGATGRSIFSRAQDNPFTRLNVLAGDRVERALRGTLAFDLAWKGQTSKDILDAVYKFHFNYDDLSKFERNVGRRLFPFYTWTRKNLPLQLEMMIVNPKWMNRVEMFKKNMEKHSPEETIYPFWYTKTFNIRMPFKTSDGDQIYMMPGLPINDVEKLFTDPGSTLGNLTPLIKAPIEMKTGVRLTNNVPFREGKTEIPAAWNYLGVGYALRLIGKAEVNSDGVLVAKEADLAALESMIPILGRSRRLFPADTESEDKYSRRVAWTWLNTMLGLGFYVNTPEDQAIELWRRTKEVQNINTELESMGFGGYREFTREVAVTRKPREGEPRPSLIVSQRRRDRARSSYKTPRKGTTVNTRYDAALRRIARDDKYSDELQDIVRKIQEKRKS